MTPIALVRAVPESFPRALVQGQRPAIDLDRARAQHDSYRELLAGAGYEVVTVPADEEHPDCPFVEDTAVVLDTIAVVARPGAPERRGEVAPVAAVLEQLLPLRLIGGPATIDGGDVLWMGSTLFVGVSTRTNVAAINQLREFAAEDALRLVPVPVANVLHLKSAVVAIDDETVLLAPDCVDSKTFAAYRIIAKAPGEAHLASLLRLRSGGLAMTSTAPRTLASVRAAGYDPMIIDNSEFQAADGGLTCLSILLDRNG